MDGQSVESRHEPAPPSSFPAVMLRTALIALALSGPALAQGTTKKPAGTAKTAATAPAAKRSTAPAARPKSTLSGVYTLEEASAGKEMYASLCASCHTAASHTGPAFRNKWSGKPLSQLYVFMKTMMPKNEPGSLADEDYSVLLAYMLQMNQMPAGKAYLSTDTTVLAKIRIDTVRAVRKP
jgi:S-disulfanyl-L-cysteine oxidoreductase SoxD